MSHPVIDRRMFRREVHNVAALYAGAAPAPSGGDVRFTGGEFIITEADDATRFSGGGFVVDE